MRLITLGLEKPLRTVNKNQEFIQWFALFLCTMSPSLACVGFILFLGLFLPTDSHLNLYMDAKETFRLLGEIEEFSSIYFLFNKLLLHFWTVDAGLLKE